LYIHRGMKDIKHAAIHDMVVGNSHSSANALQM
jgi:hypothetical protein